MFFLSAAAIGVGIITTAVLVQRVLRTSTATMLDVCTGYSLIDRCTMLEKISVYEAQLSRMKVAWQNDTSITNESRGYQIAAYFDKLHATVEKHKLIKSVVYFFDHDMSESTVENLVDDSHDYNGVNALKLMANIGYHLEYCTRRNNRSIPSHYDIQNYNSCVLDTPNLMSEPSDTSASDSDDDMRDE